MTETTLLDAFNRRESLAFSKIYRLLYRPLYLYAARLLEPLNLPPEDAIQDVFLDIWQRHTLRFPTLDALKAFCFVALKNHYKNHLKHLAHHQQYQMDQQAEADFSTETRDAEQISQLYDALPLLPPDLATVIRLYLEGYKPAEIADRLGIALQTVYNRRQQAIQLLRQHFNT